jgi:Protein of unknown function (DUF2934)
MSKETTVSRITPAMPAATSHTAPDGEKTGLVERAATRAAAHQRRVTQRAYELYEERGRQEGRTLDDWLNAERQLAGAPSQS